MTTTLNLSIRSRHIPCHLNRVSSHYHTPPLPPIRPERIPRKFTTAPPTWLRAIRRRHIIPYITHLLLCFRDQVHDHMVRSGCIPISRIDLVILHFIGTNVDDGKKDRRRKEIVGRLGKEMNDRRDECVSPFASIFSHPVFKQGAIASPAGANTPSQSLHFTAWPCNSPHAQKRFRRIRFACIPSPSSAQHYSRSWRWKNGILSKVQRLPTNWSENAWRRNGSVVGTGYESDFLRVSRSGDGERETKRTEREPSVVRGPFFFFVLYRRGRIVEALFTFTYRGCTRFPIASAHHA